MDRYAKTFTVRWADCDANVHMRNTAYSEYAVDVRIAFLAEHGFGLERFAALAIGPVILREEIDYLREVRLGETLTVDYAQLGLSPEVARFKFAHEFTRSDGTTVARIVVSGGWMDLRARRLAPAPEELARVIRAVPKAPGFEVLPPLKARGG